MVRSRSLRSRDCAAARRFLVVILSAFTTLSAAPPPAPAKAVQFNRDIRRIMADTCFRCHGPDAKARMAGLRLDLREEALKPNKAGIAPIVPGDPDKSGIIQRIFSTDGKIIFAEIRP